jgi:hypothetical protein
MQPQRLTHNIDRPLKPARSNSIYRPPSGQFAQLLAADARAWTSFPSVIASSVSSSLRLHWPSCSIAASRQGSARIYVRLRTDLLAKAE